MLRQGGCSRLEFDLIDACLNGRACGRIKLQTDGQTDRRTDRQTDRRTDGQMDRRTEGRNIYELTDRWMDGLVDERRIHSRTNGQTGTRIAREKIDRRKGRRRVVDGRTNGWTEVLT